MSGFFETTEAQALLGEGFQIIAAASNLVQGIHIALVRQGSEKKLFVSRPRPGFNGLPYRNGLLCPLNWQNARALMSLIPELQPKRVPPGPSFGFGDRLGLATPGHVQAVAGASVFPIFVQQSMRENARTGRSFSDVLTDAIFGVFQAGYTQGYGADADHLKSVDEARNAARLGYSFFTCDPSDFLGSESSGHAEELSCLRVKRPWSELQAAYLNQTFHVPGVGDLRFTKEELLSFAVKYWKALDFVEEMYRALSEELPQGFDFELSIDETSEPTTVKEHVFLVLELRRRGVQLTSLAPRFPGDMEKGVDYRGDLEEFRRALRAHVAIARFTGPYRISLHSGSDKWSLYPILAQETAGLWHVKTAGTSYLIALEVLARFCPALFREILILARASFSVDRQSYHISTIPQEFPDFQSLRDDDLLGLFQVFSVRQMLHVTFGSVLKKYGEDIKRELLRYEQEYHKALAQHLGRHLQALGVRDDVRV